MAGSAECEKMHKRRGIEGRPPWLGEPPQECGGIHASCLKATFDSRDCACGCLKCLIDRSASSESNLRRENRLFIAQKTLGFERFLLSAVTFSENHFVSIHSANTRFTPDPHSTAS